MNATVEKRDPFPLQWPDGWARTTSRYGSGTSSHQAKFEARFARDRDSVIRQLKMRGSQIVITSNLPTRSDGLPYASASFNQYDPGVAVYWVEKGRERVLACDRWRSCDLNLRAIDMSLEALRGLSRWGATDMVDRAFAGFAALPPAGATATGTGEPEPPPVRPWREILTGTNWAALDGNVPKHIILNVAKTTFRELMLDVHPDRGGDDANAAALNAAMAMAEAELGSA